MRRCIYYTCCIYIFFFNTLNKRICLYEYTLDIVRKYSFSNINKQLNFWLMCAHHSVGGSNIDAHVFIEFLCFQSILCVCASVLRKIPPNMPNFHLLLFFYLKRRIHNNSVIIRRSALRTWKCVNFFKSTSLIFIIGCACTSSEMYVIFIVTDNMLM